MKNTLGFLSAFLLFCGVASAQVPTKGGGTQVQTKGGSVQPAPVEREMYLMMGSFESRKGVMDPASCHGYNIGYMNTGQVTYVICFDQMPGGGDVEVNCEGRLEVQGYFETHTVSGAGGPCPDSTLEIFYVASWRCI